MFKSELLQPLTQVSCDYCVDATMDMQHPYTLDPCSTSVYEFHFTSSHNSLVRKSIGYVADMAIIPAQAPAQRRKTGVSSAFSAREKQ
jgi:hypothetical protein